MKQCNICGLKLPLDKFYQSRQWSVRFQEYRSTIRPDCRVCNQKKRKDLRNLSKLTSHKLVGIGYDLDVSKQVEKDMLELEMELTRRQNQILDDIKAFNERQKASGLSAKAYRAQCVEALRVRQMLDCRTLAVGAQNPARRSRDDKDIET